MGTGAGPANIWELMMMLAYEGWYLQIGLVVLLSSFILFYKRRKKV
ncbi:LPXTG cell wall anchor domain-containing protein [Brevibacillus invocatus]|uniref:LPXTG cell wall anchor domain-containing protein n=1 Tax=Brevibacillus invocatus TaxID=173959 RepID=A0A3M8CFX3_9BACL|nr:LPXTG cell wall anchor domain-containing protein [Brevibacillus invocatus]